MANQIMAPLPKAKLASTFRLFERTLVDYAGPYINVRMWIEKRKEVALLFTCLTTRAVHLEVS